MIVDVNQNDYFKATGEAIQEVDSMAWKPIKFYLVPKKIPAFLVAILGLVFGCLSVAQIVHVHFTGL